MPIELLPSMQYFKGDNPSAENVARILNTIEKVLYVESNHILLTYSALKVCDVFFALDIHLLEPWVNWITQDEDGGWYKWDIKPKREFINNQWVNSTGHRYGYIHGEKKLVQDWEHQIYRVVRLKKSDAAATKAQDEETSKSSVRRTTIKRSEIHGDKTDIPLPKWDGYGDN